MAVANRDLSSLKVLCRYGANINEPRATGIFFQRGVGSVYYGEHVIAFAVCTVKTSNISECKFSIYCGCSLTSYHLVILVL